MDKKMSILFNQICINEEMLLKDTYFKLHDPAAHQFNSTLECRYDLVRIISINTHSYKVVMLMQRLHDFCNIHTPDDSPRLGRKY